MIEEKAKMYYISLQTFLRFDVSLSVEKFGFICDTNPSAGINVSTQHPAETRSHLLCDDIWMVRQDGFAVRSFQCQPENSSQRAHCETAIRLTESLYILII